MSKMCKICGKESYLMPWQNECDTCRRKNYQADLKADILSGEETSTDCEDEVICPWCGEVYEIDDDYDMYEDGDHDRECYHCNKEFKINTSISYTFSTERQSKEAPQ